MSNWNIGDWFQGALDALRGSQQQQQPPEPQGTITPPEWQGFGQTPQWTMPWDNVDAREWTTFDPAHGDYGPYNLDDGAIPVLSGLGDMGRHIGDAIGNAATAWGQPWLPQDPKEAADVQGAWDAAARAGVALQAADPSPWLPDGLNFLDENYRGKWWQAVQAGAGALGTTINAASTTGEQGPLSGVVKGLESIGGATSALAGGALEALAIPAQGVEEFGGDIANALGISLSDIPGPPPVELGKLVGGWLNPEAARKQQAERIAGTQLQMLRKTLNPEQKQAVDDYLSTRAYSTNTTRLAGANEILAGKPLKQVKEERQDLLQELAGQIVLDPLNFIDEPFKALKLTKTLTETDKVRAAAVWAPRAGFTPETAKALTHADMLKATKLEGVTDIPRYLASHDPSAIRDGIVAKTALAMDALRTGLGEDDMAKLPSRIAAFVKGDADGVAATGGWLNKADAQMVIDSEAGVHARAMLKDLMTNPETGKIDGDVFSRIMKDAETVNGAMTALMQKTADILNNYAPLPDQAAAWERVKSAQGWVKNIASHLFVGNPGVVMGNIVGNELTMAYDGIRATEGLDVIQDLMRKRGIDPKRAVGGGLGVKPITQMETDISQDTGRGYGETLRRLAKRPDESMTDFVKSWATGSRMLESYGEVEKASRIRAYWGAMLQYERQLAPVLVGDLSAQWAARGKALGEVEAFLKGRIGTLNPDEITAAVNDLRATVKKGMPLPPTVESVVGEAAKTALWEAKQAGMDDLLADINKAVAEHGGDPAALDKVLADIKRRVTAEYNATAQKMRNAAAADAVATETIQKAQAKAPRKKEYKTQDGVGAVEAWRGEQVTPEYEKALQAKFGPGAAADFAAEHANVHTRAWEGFRDWAKKLDDEFTAKYAKQPRSKGNTRDVAWSRKEDLKAEATRRIFARELAYLRAVEDVNGGVRNVDPAARYFDNIKGFFTRKGGPITDAELARGKAWLEAEGLMPQPYQRVTVTSRADEAAAARKAAPTPPAAATPPAPPAQAAPKNREELAADLMAAVSKGDFEGAQRITAELDALKAQEQADFLARQKAAAEALTPPPAAVEPVAQAATPPAAVVEQAATPPPAAAEAVAQTATPPAAVVEQAVTPPPAAVEPVVQAATPPPAPVVPPRTRYQQQLADAYMAARPTLSAAEQAAERDKIDLLMNVNDAIGRTWSKFTGKSLDDFYAMLEARRNPEVKGLFSTGAPVFYLQSQRAVEALKQERFTARELRGILDKNGVKAEERKWLGLDDLIAQKGDAGRLTKQEVLDTIRQNDVRIETVTLPREPRIIGTSMNGEPIEEPMAAFEPRYSEYTLPGGTNYREHLLTLKANTSAHDAKLKALADEESALVKTIREAQRSERETQIRNRLNEIQRSHPGNTTREQWAALSAERATLENELEQIYQSRMGQTIARLNVVRNEMGNLNVASPDLLYQSGHFDTPNIVVHTRTTDRVTPDGKRILFLEEVQSDWGQAGRAEGFASPESVGKLQANADAAYEDLRRLLESPEYKSAKAAKDQAYYAMEAHKPGAAEAYDAASNNLKAVERSIGLPEAHRNLDEARRAVSTAEEGIKAAPFVGDTEQYSTLAMKRMLRYAADNGYDGIAWTNGIQQAERYSKQLQEAVDTLRYAPNGELVGIKNGAEVWRQSVPQDQLGNFVGKTVAKTLLDTGEASGKDIVVGAEGFRQLYDRQLPSYMDKVAKKFGGKTGLADLGEGIGMVPEIAITPAMRAGAQQGFPLFSDMAGPRLGVFFREGDTARVIGLFDGALPGTGPATFETIAHETGHLMRSMMDELAAMTVDDASGAFAKFKDDYAKLTDWATDGAGWGTRELPNVPGEEKFANGLTQYLRGNLYGIPEALHQAFEQIKAWLMELIGKAGTDNLAPDVAAAYRRFLTQYEDVGRDVARKQIDDLAATVQKQLLDRGDMKGGAAMASSYRRGGKGEPIYMATLNKHRAAGTEPFTAANIANRIEEATQIMQDYAVTGHVSPKAKSVLRDAGVSTEVIAATDAKDAEQMAEEILDKGKVKPAAVEPVLEVTPQATVTVPRPMPARFAEEDLAKFFAGTRPRDVLTPALSARGDLFAPIDHEIPGFVPPQTIKKPFGGGTVLVDERGKEWKTAVMRGDLVEGWRKAVSKYLTGDEDKYDEVVQIMRAQRVRTLLPSEADAAKIGKALLPESGVHKTVKDYVLAKIEEAMPHIQGGGIAEIVVPGYGKITLNDSAQAANAYGAFGGFRQKDKDFIALFGEFGIPHKGKYPPMTTFTTPKPAEHAAGIFNLDPNAPPLTKGKPGGPLFHTAPPQDDLHAIMDAYNDAVRRGDAAAIAEAEAKLKAAHANGAQYDAALRSRPHVKAPEGTPPVRPDDIEFIGQRAGRIIDAIGGDLKQYGGAVIPPPRGITLAEANRLEQDLQSRATILRGKAQEYGAARRDFALLDGKRRNVDTLMNFVYPFHYWYTRSYVNWGKRALDNPALPLSYMKVQNTLQQINKDAPPQYRNSIPLDIAGTRQYFDWQQMLNPLRALVDDFNVPQRQKTDFGKLLNAAGSWGSAPWQLWTWGYALAQAAQGDTETLQAYFNYALPATRVLRAASALMRENGVKSLPLLGDIPAGGYYPEDKLFNAYGVVGQGDMWEARRIGKALSDLLGDKHPVTGKPITMTDITRAAYYREGPLWDEARQKALVDQAPGTLMSFFGMRGLKLRSEDLAKQEQAADEYFKLNKRFFEDRSISEAQYTAERKAFYEKYPWYSVVRMAKQNDMERVSTFTMDVLNRIPPGQRTATYDELNIKAFVDGFWKAQDRDQYLTEQKQKAPLAYKRFIAAIETLDANYNIPSAQTRNEWDNFKALQEKYYAITDLDQRRQFKAQNPLMDKYMPDSDSDRFWKAYYALDPLGRQILRDVPELKGIDLYIDKGTREMLNDKTIRELAITTELFAARLAETPAYKAYVNEVQTKYGGNAIYDIQSGYYDIPQDDRAARRKYLQDHPALEAFWDWRDGYLKMNPALKAAFQGKGTQPVNVAAAVNKTAATDSAQAIAVAAKAKFGDDIFDVQNGYFAIPETDKAQRKAYLAANPQLGQYWDWKNIGTTKTDSGVAAAARVIRNTMGADFATYAGIPFLHGGGGGGGAGLAYINAVRKKYAPGMSQNEFISAVGKALKVAPFYATQPKQGGGGYAPNSVRFLVPFSKR